MKAIFSKRSQRAIAFSGRVSGVAHRLARRRRAARIDLRLARLARHGASFRRPRLGVRAAFFAVRSRRMRASLRIDPPRDDARERSSKRESLSHAVVEAVAEVKATLGHDVVPTWVQLMVSADSTSPSSPPRTFSGVSPHPRLLRILLPVLLRPRPDPTPALFGGVVSDASAAAGKSSTDLPSASPPRSCPASRPSRFTPGRQPPVARPGAVDARHPRRPDEDRTDGSDLHPQARSPTPGRTATETDTETVHLLPYRLSTSPPGPVAGDDLADD